MKKLFFLLLIINTILSASSSDVEVKIYNSIFFAIFPDKSIIKVWVDEDSKRDVFQKTKNLKIVDSKEEADILLILKSKEIKTKKMSFVGSYLLLKHYKKSTLGGFFWQKGRPNIMFLKKNLEKNNIRLPESFDRYIEDEL